MTDQTTIKIPSKYREIIQEAIDFLVATNNTSNWQNSNYKKLNYLLKKETDFNFAYLIPIGIYKTDHCEFYLTKEDVEILLDYPFVIDRETLIFALNKLGVVTKNGNKINQATVYKWKILKTQTWKDRYKKLMTEYWNWNGSAYTAKETKRKIIEKIDSPKYNSVWEEIKEKIEANHESD